MTGISTVSKRRLPASLSSRLMAAPPMTVEGQRTNQPRSRARLSRLSLILPVYSSSFILHRRSIMARHRLDGVDDLFVRHFVGAAKKARVPAVHQDGPVALGIPAQRGNELTALGVVERTEVHGSLLPRTRTTRNPARWPDTTHQFMPFTAGASS